jgi:ligand-binding sensor domain-containing protein
LKDRAKKLNLKGLTKLIYRLLQVPLNSMMQRLITLFIGTFIIPFVSFSQLQPIGNWRDHLPYHQAIQVTATPGKIWAANPSNLFSLDIDENSIERWSKINGLTETGIKAIGADAASGKLVIAYTSSNVDVLDGSSINNINAVKNSPVTGDKTIYSIYVVTQLAYLSTGIGIIVLDLSKYEVKDTYIIGAGGSKIKVNATTAGNSFFYAATKEGLKKAPVNSANLADFRNWLTESGTNGLAAGEVQSVVSTGTTVITLKDDSLFTLSGTTWNLLYRDGWTINNITISNNKLLISERQNNSGRVVILSLAGAVETILQDNRFTALPLQAVIEQNNYWIADSLAGLSKYNGSTFESYIPNSPASVSTGGMRVNNNTLWVTAGAVTINWEPAKNKNGVFKFSDNTWTNYNASGFPQLDSFPDFITVAIDPADESAWAGSYGGGLIQIKKDNTITAFKQNSPLKPAYFDLSSYRVSGLAFDTERNLWIANYGGSSNLHVRKQDGTWQSFAIPFPLAESAVSQVVIDDINQKWIVSPKGGGLICYNHGLSVDNPGDDQWKWYRAGQGNGNLPDNYVLCIAKDKNNFIWVGTEKGVGIIQCAQDVFTTQGCEAILPVVQQDNFAGYLFSDEQVQTIAVDGADRKWVGTKNGVWLISADGAKTIYRFTETNSPLVSNDVKQITIDDKTGEVFFATSNGICSFRSTATEGVVSNSNVLVFPNPVPPGYSGTIAIRGVANNAIVKIAELNGRLVYQARALGGQAIWNGKDYKGRTISTGVYLVIVSDDTQQEKTVTKIVYIKK